MSATPEQTARLRRMVAEVGKEGYTDDDLAFAIEQHPFDVDAAAIAAAETRPYTQYDINAAAADIWQEKAADVAEDFDYSDQGASFTRSQKHAQAMQQARYYLARRRPKTITITSDPPRRSARLRGDYDL